MEQEVAVDVAPEQQEVAETQQVTESQEVQTPQKEELDETGLPKGVRRSIDRLTRQRYQERARADMLESKVRELESKLQPQQTARQEKPEDFDSWEQYVEARATRIAEERVHDALSKREQQAALARQQEFHQRAATDFQARAEKATERYPDFFETVESSSVPMSEAMSAVIITSEAGPDLAYHLAHNPAEADRIYRLPAYLQAAEMARLEAKIKRPEAKQISKAPAPINPVGGNAAVKKDPSKMTDKEFDEWRRTQIKARGK